MKYDNHSKESPELEQAIREITDLLATMTREQRLAWFKRNMYAEPLAFIQEIDGTVYAVRSHFQPDAGENITEKVGRILSKPSI